VFNGPEQGAVKNMATIIEDKAALKTYLDECLELKELRDAMLPENNAGMPSDWPEVRRETIRLIGDKPYLKTALGMASPPAYGADWSAWLKANLAAVADEATSIVL
jgi:hypothetical protein